MFSPFSPVSSAQLAVAALFGASVMAISAFYIHKRSVDQVLDRLLNIRRRRHHLLPSDDEHCEYSDFDEASETDRSVIVWRSKNKLLSSSEYHDKDGESDAVRDCGVSSSMPNSSALKNDRGGDEAGIAVNSILSYSLSKIDSISSDLPPVRTDQRNGEEPYVNHSGTSMRVGSAGRLVTPRSAGGYAFESTGDSDDDGTELEVEEDVLSYQNDINLTTQNQHILQAQASNGIYVHVQESEAIVTEAKSDTDLTDGKVDRNPANDPVFSNNTFPPITTLHGFVSDALQNMKSDSMSVEEQEVTRMIRECLDLREKYVFRENVDPWTKCTEKTGLPEAKNDPFNFVPVDKSSHFFRMEDGVVHVYASERDTEELFPVASSTSFFTDMHHLLKVMSIGNVRSACHHRLRFLEEKFRLHLLVNADKEFVAQKSSPHRDFYNIRKVDTHVHHSACMNQKHLLRFIKSKLRKEPDEVVIYRDGQYLTLKEVFDSLDLTGYDLNVDLLDVHADKSTFHRFDKFNLKYNPCGQSRLREIFLKQDNLIQGRFLADVTKQVLSDLEASKYQLAEYRISIYGRKQSEWDQLASWFVNNRIYSENAVWLIQLPRLYNIYRSMGTVTSFQNILDNIFIPLFEVTVDPNSHPHLHLFLLQVVGFDMVDDESKPERRPTKHMPTPSQWTNEFNPAFSYYAYYCYANAYTLNRLRESKGLPTIRFRPHCGEAGDVDHLAAGFLLCHNISHGINLRKSPVLQYLYYLAQIGLAMSPLSNNSLFLDYHRNPFPMFFQRGLNVSLSTDDPLQIHLTKEPLVEEYSVAAKVWKLSSCDLCEIARNSVYQSGFSHAAKLHWLGDDYFKRGPIGNVIHKTNVPNIRIDFRHETWKAEMQYVYSGKAILPEEIDH
ncbi:AMP deaminase [Perilla frutescens var. hirtella]|uniref:AMP deaminase n=1 Tax=Perilla frutescens var. hirtella TaxID=608512 RepID=A0AAD4NX28_PERFH|nr:AMP deaminase [Perilla frutescens var. hirtella]